MDGYLPSTGLIRIRAAGKREAPRHRQHGLACSAGDVIDLSTSGLRIRCRHALSGRIDIALTEYTRPGELVADVVWIRPSGNFHYEAGLKFRRMSREMTSRIAAIAGAHRFRRAV